MSHSPFKLLGSAAIAAAAAIVMMAPAASAQDPQVQFGFGIGPDGKPSISFGINTPPPPPEDVCFYERSRYRGDSFCVEVGNTINNLGDWGDEISSFENPSGLRVTVCTRTRLRGDCRVYTGNARTLGDFDDDIESLRIRNP